MIGRIDLYGFGKGARAFIHPGVAFTIGLFRTRIGISLEGLMYVQRGLVWSILDISP